MKPTEKSPEIESRERMKICLWKRIFLAINCLLHGHKPCNYEDLNASQCLNGTLD